MRLVTFLAFHMFGKWIIKAEYNSRRKKSYQAMKKGWYATPDNLYPWDKMSKIDLYFSRKGYFVKCV